MMTRREALQELGLPLTNAWPSATELKTAYRKRSIETHPDKPGGSSEAFVRVSQAYEGLKSSERSGTTTSGSPTMSTEEQMKYAEDVFYREFQDILENPEQASDKFVDMIFDSLLWNGTATAGELSFTTRQIKRVVKFVARRVVNMLKRAIIEADYMEININGQTMSMADVQKIQEILQKQQRQQTTMSKGKQSQQKQDL